MGRGSEAPRLTSQAQAVVAGHTLGEYVRFVRRYPDVLDRLLSIWNAFDLEALRRFLENLDLGEPYEAPPLGHRRYVENRDAIRRIVSAAGAFSAADRGYLPRSLARRVYSASAKAYDSVWDSVWTYENRRDLLGALELRPGDRLLEVGIGTGNNLRHLPPGTDVTGIDFSPEMLATCRVKAQEARLGALRLLAMDAHELKFPDETFDKILCFYSLCAVEDPFLVLGEVARVMVPLGRLVIYDVVLSDIPEVALLQHLYRPIARELGAIYLEFCPPGNITYDACFEPRGPVQETRLRVVRETHLDPFRTVLLGVYEKHG